MTKTKKRTIISVIIILLIAVVTILLFRFINYQEEATSPDDSGSTDLIQAAENNPDTTDTEDSSITESVPEENQDNATVQYEGANPNDESQTVDAVLTYYGLQKQEYIINVNIAQYITGTCELSLGSYTSSVTIDQAAATSACSFHIAPSNLQSGQQNLIIKIKGDGRSGRIEEKIDVSL